MYDFGGKQVLVAGGTGLIGTQLVKLLIGEEGAEVRIASLDHPSRAHPDADFMQINLLRHECCQWACAEVDYVFNLLCMKGSPESVLRQPAKFFEENLLLDINLLRAAREMGVAGYLLASSLAVYPPAEVFREDNIWSGNPSKNDWWAAWAKRMGELQAEAYRREYGWTGISVVRPANTYGPFDDFWSENAMVIPSLIRRAVEGENPIRVWGDGSQVRDFIHARDVARGMIHVAKRGITEPVNLGSGTGVTIRELVQVIVGNLEVGPEVVLDVSKPIGDRIRVLDTTRARSIGFVPQITLAEGLRETVAWYKENRRQPSR